MSNYYQIKRQTIDTVNWTPVVTPSDCSTISMYRDDSDKFRVRTNTADPLQELVVGIGIAHTIVTQGSPGIAFPSGTIVCYVQGYSQAGVVVIEFIR
jgi:hypothetical protein